MKDPRVTEQIFLLQTYANRALTITRGEGVYLFVQQGNKYLDMMSNYGASILGHAHPQYTKALSEQLQTLTNLHGSFANDVRAQVAVDLVTRVGSGMKRAFFLNSGTEAVEAAIKFAMLASGKSEIIAMENGYHGKTFAALSATTGDDYRMGLQDRLVGVKFAKYADIDSLSETITSKTAAVILEPIQGDGGINVPYTGYLKEVEKLCRDRGVLLIVDEIQTGTGRTGKFVNIGFEQITPDILCLGKGLAGGIPTSAVLVTNEVAKKIHKGAHTSTFGGNPLAMRGIQFVLSFLTDEFLQEVSEKGEYFRDELSKLNMGEVRGEGLMIGLDVEDRDGVLKYLQKNGVLAIPAAKKSIRFLPPYIIEKKHIDEVISVLKSYV